MEKQKYYITTAIAYTSGKPHIGNTYEVVKQPTDGAMPRNYRLMFQRSLRLNTFSMVTREASFLLS